MNKKKCLPPNNYLQTSKSERYFLASEGTRCRQSEAKGTDLELSTTQPHFLLPEAAVQSKGECKGTQCFSLSLSHFSSSVYSKQLEKTTVPISKSPSVSASASEMISGREDSVAALPSSVGGDDCSKYTGWPMKSSSRV